MSAGGAPRTRSPLAPLRPPCATTGPTGKRWDEWNSGRTQERRGAQREDGEGKGEGAEACSEFLEARRLAALSPKKCPPARGLEVRLPP